MAAPINNYGPERYAATQSPPETAEYVWSRYWDRTGQCFMCMPQGTTPETYKWVKITGLPPTGAVAALHAGLAPVHTAGDVLYKERFNRVVQASKNGTTRYHLTGDTTAAFPIYPGDIGETTAWGQTFTATTGTITGAGTRKNNFVIGLKLGNIVSGQTLFTTGGTNALVIRYTDRAAGGEGWSFQIGSETAVPVETDTGQVQIHSNDVLAFEVVSGRPDTYTDIIPVIFRGSTSIRCDNIRINVPLNNLDLSSITLTQSYVEDMVFASHEGYESHDALAAAIAGHIGEEFFGLRYVGAGHDYVSYIHPLILTELAGTGERIVAVDANGKLQAASEGLAGFITDDALTTTEVDITPSTTTKKRFSVAMGTGRTLSDFERIFVVVKWPARSSPTREGAGDIEFELDVRSMIRASTDSDRPTYQKREAASGPTVYKITVPTVSDNSGLTALIFDIEDANESAPINVSTLTISSVHGRRYGG